MIDYGSTQGAKLFIAATKELPSKFDSKSNNLNLFLSALHDRSIDSVGTGSYWSRRTPRSRVAPTTTSSLNTASSVLPRFALMCFLTSTVRLASSKTLAYSTSASMHPLPKRLRSQSCLDRFHYSIKNDEREELR
jgi:hypothetical protein